MHSLGYVPSNCTWISPTGSTKPLIAVSSSDKEKPWIYIYNVLSDDVDEEGIF